MGELINIGMETFILRETDKGYKLKSFCDDYGYNGSTEQLSGSVCRLIDEICSSII